MFLLIIYTLSGGLYQEPHSTLEMCRDTLMEAALVRGSDLWSGVCVGPDDEEIIGTVSRDIGP